MKPALTAQAIKRKALAFGADEVAIGNIERWEGAPIQQDPRQIMPECRSIIAMSFRVMRGSLRGIEEGTYFSNYSAMGYGGLTYLYMPMTVINLAKFIEDDGYEAIPYGHQSDWRSINNIGALKERYSRPVAPGRAAPDVMVNLRIASHLAGLGEIGFSKMFLSPKFGPRCRVGIILTDLRLDPDPIIEQGTLCDKCFECVKACPAGALKKSKTVKQLIDGKEMEWTDIDCAACNDAFVGAKRTRDDVPDDMAYKPKHNGFSFKRGTWSPFFRKPRNLYNTGQAVCGARGCTRACMMHLEAQGKLGNKFHQPFRRRKPWRVDWSDVDDAKTNGKSDKFHDNTVYETD